MAPGEQSALEGFGGPADDPPGNTTTAVSPVTEPAGTAAYIAELTAELSGLARSAGLEALAYVLDIAQFEANRLARTRPFPGSS